MSTPLTIVDFVTAVEDGVFDEHISKMFDTLNSRSRKLRDRRGLEALITAKAGDKVSLRNIKPKALKNATGTVVRIGEKHIYVKLDDPLMQPSGVRLPSRYAFAGELGIAPSCIVIEQAS